MNVNILNKDVRFIVFVRFESFGKDKQLGKAFKEVKFNTLLNIITLAGNASCSLAQESGLFYWKILSKERGFVKIFLKSWICCDVRISDPLEPEKWTQGKIRGWHLLEDQKMAMNGVNEVVQCSGADDQRKEALNRDWWRMTITEAIGFLLGPVKHLRNYTGFKIRFWCYCFRFSVYHFTDTHNLLTYIHTCPFYYYRLWYIHGHNWLPILVKFWGHTVCVSLFMKI